MSDITNLTDRITHLRDRKNTAGSILKKSQGKMPLSGKARARGERRFSIDYFMLVAYSLLGAAIISQFFLIVWLDII